MRSRNPPAKHPAIYALKSPQNTLKVILLLMFSKKYLL